MAAKKRKQKRRRTRTDHRGVKLFSRRWSSGTESWFARWCDPDSGKVVDTSMSKLGMTNAELRRDWAIRKSQALARRRAEIALGVEPIADPIKIDVLIADYLARCRVRLADVTVDSYAQSLNLFAEWAAAEGIGTTHKLTPPALGAYREWLSRSCKLTVAAGGRRGERKPTRQLRSARSMNDDLARVGTLLRETRRLGKLPFATQEDIENRLKRFRDHKPLPTFLRPQEIKSLLQAAQRHDAATFAMTRAEKAVGLDRPRATARHDPCLPFLLFVLLTGCRAKEARCLRWTDVYLAGQDSEIVLKPDATKTRHGRSVELSVSPSLISVLSSLRLQAGEQAYVFGGDQPRSKGALKRERARLIEGYGAPRFTWQQLRSTCATYLVNAPGIYGASSAFQSSKRLGHGVVVAEQRYVGLLRRLDPEARTLEAVMGVEKLIANLGQEPGDSNNSTEAIA